MDIESRLKKFKPDVSSSSIKLYLSKLKKFLGKNKILQRKTFNDTEKIINKIKTDYPNISTQKSILTALVVYLRCYVKPNTKIIEIYKNEMLNTLKQENDETFKQRKTHKQEENWISMDEYINVINTLQGKVKDIIKKNDLTNKEYSLLQNYIILRMYHEYPFRNDLATLQIVNDGDTIDDNKNYLITGKEYKIILQSYKTSKTYGKREYILSNNLKYIVKKLLLHNKCGFLLCNKSDRNKQLTKNNLTLNLQHIFKVYTNKKISTSMLRHIQATEMNKNTPSLQSQEKEAENKVNKFLHNNLQNQLYAKKE